MVVVMMVEEVRLGIVSIERGRHKPCLQVWNCINLISFMYSIVQAWFRPRALPLMSSQPPSFDVYEPHHWWSTAGPVLASLPG